MSAPAAAAVGPGAARRGAWGARTAFGHRRRLRLRGARGGDKMFSKYIDSYASIIGSLCLEYRISALNIGSLCLGYRSSMLRVHIYEHFFEE